ncbi:hypothetical protein [Comamonas thiooxydans]|uniref:hypothetical protein n=1 Tax=Comamonas thiooxydans TaxID=363952 RepID=UPI003D00BEAC
MNNLSQLPRVSTTTNAKAHYSLFLPDMPVSYNTARDVVSRFGDPFWDLSSMSPDATTINILNFYDGSDGSTSELALVIREQQKALMWHHMDSGRTRAWVTLYNTNMALNIWCKAAEQRGVNLYAFLCNIDWVSEIAQRLNVNYLYLTKSALKTLWRHRETLGVPINFSLDNLRKYLGKEVGRRPETKQTPLIPSRVYSAILSALSENMNLIERELDGFHVEVKYNPLAERLPQYQMTLMILVAAYTGMRVSEVVILPFNNVLVEFEHMGSKHYEVQGSTQKLNNGVKQKTAWVTCSEGVRAVQLAQRIARMMRPRHVEPAKAGQQFLLFPLLTNPYKKMPRGTINRLMEFQRKAICPVVESGDIEELDRLELDRGWGRDGIEVGSPWPLAFHQLRRSLAVYAQCSGMVRLPTLKAQLKQITQEMASYYSTGFSRAVNLFFDKDHFSHEWRAAKAESSYFAFVFGVLLSDDALLGSGAQRMAQAVEARSRQDTLRLFMQNKLAYQETPLGGCVSTDNCKIDPLEPIPYQCIETNCLNQVVFSKRLEHIIKHQKMAVTILERDEKGSVEHRLEVRFLEVLLKASERQKKGS